VEADDLATASKDLAAHRQELMNAQAKSEFEQASIPGKMGAVVSDVGRVGADALTFGFLDKLMGGDEAMKTTAARSRMGGADIPIDILAAIGAIPTAVPKAVAKMGGGPAARWLTGTTTAGAEGGVVGGLQAAGHQQDAPGGATVGPSVGEGVVTGALGGAAGQQIGAGVNKAANWYTGANAVPQGIRSKITMLPQGQKNPSAADRINVAANTAESKASVMDDPLAQQSRYRKNFEELLRESPSKTFNPAQKSMMQRIIKEEPATKVSRGLGDFLGDKLAIGSAGIGAGVGVSPVVGALVAGGFWGGSRALKGMSSGGTQEAVDDLRRLLAKKTRTEGPLSARNQGRLTKGVRQGVLDKYLYDDEE
jgi:hypothetical protein